MRGKLLQHLFAGHDMQARVLEIQWCTRLNAFYYYYYYFLGFCFGFCLFCLQEENLSIRGKKKGKKRKKKKEK